MSKFSIRMVLVSFLSYHVPLLCVISGRALTLEPDVASEGDRRDAQHRRSSPGAAPDNGTHDDVSQ